MTGCPARCGSSSSAPGSAGSRPRSSCGSTASATSRCSRPRRTGSAGPGCTTPTPARRATCRATCTPTRTRSAATGRGCARRRRRSSATCARSRASTASTGWSCPAPRSTACAWDDDARRWTRRRRPTGGTWEADARSCSRPASCTGPRCPRSPGARPSPATAFHSAAWDHDYDLRGKRVAVIGTGASAVQFVPEIAPQVGKLCVFQRTGNWFLPRRNRPYPALVQGAGPARARPAGAAAAVHLPLRRVADADDPPPAHARAARARAVDAVHALAAARPASCGARPGRTTRSAASGCCSARATCRRCSAPNVELVTDADHARRRPRGRDRRRRRRTRSTASSTGPASRPPTSCSRWRSPARGGAALRDGLGGRRRTRTSASPCPASRRCSSCTGPNTNTSGGSIIVYLEAQAAYIRQALQRVRDRGRAPRSRSARGRGRGATRELQARFAGTAWTGCDSWYRDESGRIVTNWPGYMREYEARDPRRSTRRTSRCCPVSRQPTFRA